MFRQIDIAMGDMDGRISFRRAVRSAATTRDVRIAAGNLGAVPAVLRQTAPAERYVVVADDHTWKVAGSARGVAAGVGAAWRPATPSC